VVIFAGFFSLYYDLGASKEFSVIEKSFEEELALYEIPYSAK
jgi:hypothetical protein